MAEGGYFHESRKTGKESSRSGEEELELQIKKLKLKLDLSQQKDEIFYIYTSGIADGNLLKFFYRIIFPNIYESLIPVLGSMLDEKIKIIHFDPSEILMEKKRKVQNGGDGIEKKISEVFMNINFPTDLINKKCSSGIKHIVIDFAHLFYYNEDGTPYFLSEEEEKTDYPSMKVVYGGYVGNNEYGNLGYRLLSKNKKFIYFGEDIDGSPKLRTYIDDIVEKFGKIDRKYSVYPMNIFLDTELPKYLCERFEENNKKYFEELWRKKCPRSYFGVFDDLFIILINNPYFKIETFFSSNSLEDFCMKFEEHITKSVLEFMC